MVENKLPAYVKLIKNWSVDDEFIGEIFELSSLDNLSKFQSAPDKDVFRKNIIGWIESGYFEISTKEAYDSQFKSKEFEFNKWYKRNDTKFLSFIKNKKEWYGFNVHGDWFNNLNDKTELWTDSQLNGLILATTEEVESRLLEYAREKYPVGIKYESICGNKNKNNDIVSELKWNYCLKQGIYSNDYEKTSSDRSAAYVYWDGKWAEIIEEPKSKPTFNRDWYVEVNSQEEADLMFDYLESIGEKVSTEPFDRRYSRNWKYIMYYKASKHWFCNGTGIYNLTKKQLSDFIDVPQEDFKNNFGFIRKSYHIPEPAVSEAKHVKNQEKIRSILAKVNYF